MKDSGTFHIPYLVRSIPGVSWRNSILRFIEMARQCGKVIDLLTLGECRILQPDLLEIPPLQIIRIGACGHPKRHAVIPSPIQNVPGFPGRIEDAPSYPARGVSREVGIGVELDPGVGAGAVFLHDYVSTLIHPQFSNNDVVHRRTHLAGEVNYEYW